MFKVQHPVDSLLEWKWSRFFWEWWCRLDLQPFSLPVAASARYAHGPVPLQSQHYTTSQDIISSYNCVRQEMLGYEPKLSEVRASSFRLDHLNCPSFSKKLFSLLAWLKTPSRYSWPLPPYRCCRALRQPPPSQSCRREAPSWSLQRSRPSIVSLIRELQLSLANSRARSDQANILFIQDILLGSTPLKKKQNIMCSQQLSSPGCVRHPDDSSWIPPDGQIAGTQTQAAVLVLWRNHRHACFEGHSWFYGSEGAGL